MISNLAASAVHNLRLCPYYTVSSSHFLFFFVVFFHVAVAAKSDENSASVFAFKRIYNQQHPVAS